MWLLVALNGCSMPEALPVDSGMEDPFPATLVGDPDAGEGTFALHCSTCHGPAGRGGIGPDLATASVPLDDSEIYDTMVEGRPRMPPIRLTDQEAIDVIATLRRWFTSMALDPLRSTEPKSRVSRSSGRASRGT